MRLAQAEAQRRLGIGHHAWLTLVDRVQAHNRTLVPNVVPDLRHLEKMSDTELRTLISER